MKSAGQIGIKGTPWILPLHKLSKNKFTQALFKVGNNSLNMVKVG